MARRDRAALQAAQWAETQSVLGLVGTLTITWAGVERMLDELIAWYQHHGTELQAEHPRSLSAKLKYLRVMQRDPRFSPETQEFLRQTRIEAKRLGDARHDLIHGLLHRRPWRGGAWHTQRVIYDGPFARVQDKAYSQEELRSIIAQASDLGGYLSPKVWVIIGGDGRRFPASDLENARRELGIS
ncbi:hypothetical protein [Polymorphobacter fuscus]|uniref:Uncharacterized protein n=1 Tax=Sandarakinorhabdus fusca TaxID=1439888 RepID=A0A7C9GWD5_9SPHN|nr:hypothetical protein [Polymorphobacter fuscus]KAB7648906.1 hypothetical protein F9290_04380 [Polymorphobacter fuscus]MQT16494.1 hypothetical protein [Polymorphobacter fuscus]NJC07216.1 hypothetical protein [Polymorphobacter fuscus]